MKTLVPLVLLFLITACKPAPKVETAVITANSAENTISELPEQLTAVFDVHGGLAQWRAMKTLIFEIPAGTREATGEMHTIDLTSRKDKIVMGDIEMGFDGKAVWALDLQNTYKGDPMFYHNLMFYFFAMPFVLGDNGIHYGLTDPLVFEGKSYPGIQIGYGDGVGTSPKDEYFIHYDPDTHQMAWLGYTVTYRSGEKSDHVKWIRYNDWLLTNGLWLPNSITWHDYEGRKIKEAKTTVHFNNVAISDQAKPKDFYGMPINAKIVKKP
jgi:hypothetical protein